MDKLAKVFKVNQSVDFVEMCDQDGSVSLGKLPNYCANVLKYCARDYGMLCILEINDNVEFK